MIDKIYDCIPKELYNVGHSLESIGSSELAWHYEDALKVVDFLANKGYGILGGDVLSFDKNGIKYTYDNWYVNRITDQNFVQESIKKTIKYIEDYVINNGCNYLFSITFRVL